jgi:hypothetical protein
MIGGKLALLIGNQAAAISIGHHAAVRALVPPVQTLRVPERLRRCAASAALWLQELVHSSNPPLHRSMQQPSVPEVRTSWDCGCVADYVDGFLDDREAVLQWGTCSEHRQIGLLSSDADLL